MSLAVSVPLPTARHRLDAAVHSPGVPKPLWPKVTLVLSVLLATASASLLAYGTDPFWAQYRRGLGLILFTHRVQWILATVSLLLCLTVVGLIVAGRRRAWWLIALGPILALFVHRFVNSPMRQFAIIETPALVKADSASAFLKDSDYVVAVQFGDAGYAYPYAALFSAPVIIQPNHEQRFILLWSALANRALAFKIDHDIKVGELQIVSMPANALLLYNGRGGEFINGVTGLTTTDQTPSGFHSEVPTRKMTFAQWKAMPHKEWVGGGWVMPARDGASEPSGPVRPKYALPRRASEPATTTQPAPETMVIFAPTTRPIAVAIEKVTPDQAANVAAGQTQLLMFRDPSTGVLRVFDRQVSDDMFPKFRRKSDPKRPAVVLEDQDAGSEWTADGKAVEGSLKGEQLRPVAVDEGVYWAVMKYWYPNLQWVEPTTVRASGDFRNPTDRRRGR
jgi:hypothetical protein